ncbi:MAG: substrate-binding domain-containing protein [Tepidisphaeraceae bacterium]
MGIAKRSLLAAATLASASALVLGAGAGTASANYLGLCGGRTLAPAIDGQGATFQRAAQGFWNPGFTSGVCSGIAVSYASTGSGAGLRAWGSDAAGGTPAASGNEFVATDDAPNATQLANIKRAANGADVVVMPSVQGAIAIVYTLPASCTITGTITNAQLEATFRGNNPSWSSLPGATGAGCSTPIRYVVRNDSSGTTYQFKHYLFAINGAAVSGASTWRDLQEINASRPTPNQTWPSTSAAPIVPTATGGGAVAAEVARTPGSIGYVSLSDAGALATFSVQNRTLPSVTFASPRSGSNANCANATYNVPAVGGRHVNVDWSNTYGGNPNIGGTIYPICTLTFEVGLAGATPATSGTAGYTTAGFANGDSVASDVRDYFNYVNSNTPSNLGYAALPNTVGSPVLAAARSAAAEVW